MLSNNKFLITWHARDSRLRSVFLTRPYTTLSFVSVFKVTINAIGKQLKIITYLHNSSHILYNMFVLGGKL